MRTSTVTIAAKAYLVGVACGLLPLMAHHFRYDIADAAETFGPIILAAVLALSVLAAVWAIVPAKKPLKLAWLEEEESRFRPWSHQRTWAARASDRRAWRGTPPPPVLSVPSLPPKSPSPYFMPAVRQLTINDQAGCQAGASRRAS